MGTPIRTVLRHPADRPRLAASVALAVLAPASVVAALEVLGNALAAFVLYHLLVCLVLPAGISAYRGMNLYTHLRWLGWRDPSNEWANPVGVGVGVASGVLLFAFVGLVGLRLVSPATAADELASWGLGASAALLLVPYMVLVNSVAEELFWRGALHSRLQEHEPRLLVMALTSALFASYHGYTLNALLGDARLAGLLTVAVFAGATIWAALREAFGSVKPAVWAHVGASAGYMAAYVVWVA